MTAATVRRWTVKVELGVGSTATEAFEEAQAIAAAQGLIVSNAKVRPHPFRRGVWAVQFDSPDPS